jgi:hemerythrin
MFEWTADYAMDIPGLDREHQSLFRIAGELHAAMVSGKGTAVMGRILDRLIQYTTVHFSHEERLMREAAYPAYEAHKAEHEALAAQVVAFSSRFSSGQATITVQLLQFLKSWLQNHIASSDRKYAPYLKERAA